MGANDFGEVAMSETVAVGMIAFVVLAYLTYALLAPERF
jgi:hypothetical protein